MAQAQHGTWYTAQLGLFGGETLTIKKPMIVQLAELDPQLAERRQRCKRPR